MKILSTLVIILLPFPTGVGHAQDIPAEFANGTPVARVIPRTDTLHGDVRVDHYYWLRDRTNPEVIRYLELENAYTEGVTHVLKPLQDKLYEEMLSRIQQTDLTVPDRIGDYFYYSRT